MKEKISLIPIDSIRILNPRHRDKRKFEKIVESIRNLGLKRPITVSVRSPEEGAEPGYDLVCGQGRIEAFRALGESEIPAVVVDATKEDRLLMSLVENMARRFSSPWDLIVEIERLIDAGYTYAAISRKLDISDALVSGMVSLRKSGEERLLEEALKGNIPLGVAVDISRATSVDAQREVLTAYQNKQLNQVSIRAIRRVMQQRRFLGKATSASYPQKPSQRTTADGLVNAFRKETQRQKVMIKKAKLCDARLTFLVAGFRQLFRDDDFVNLLRAEGSLTAPAFLLETIGPDTRK